MYSILCIQTNMTSTHTYVHICSDDGSNTIWHSGPIVEREGRYRIKTKSGSVYVLIGTINAQQAMERGVGLCECECVGLCECKCVGLCECECVGLCECECGPVCV